MVNSIGGVDSFGSVTVYPPLGSSTGILNEAPSSTIGGDSINADITGFSNPIGIALDSSANIYVSNDGSSVGGADSITVYPAGSNGNVAPSATITGLSTGLGLPQGIAIGSRGLLAPPNSSSTSISTNTSVRSADGLRWNVSSMISHEAGAR